MMHLIRYGLAVLVVLGTSLLAASSAGAVAGDAALGNDGDLYIAQAGLYGELFPDGAATVPENPVLAIEVVRDGQPSKRLLVPESAGPETERSPIVTFEPDSRTAYVLWESQTEPTVSALFLAGLGPDGWSEAIEISGDVEPLKGPPRVQATVDHFILPAEDGGRTRHTRTVLHVLWWEKADTATKVFYAPVILEDGLYIGWNAVLALNDLVAGDPREEAAHLPDSLLRTIQLMPGRDIQSSVIAFTDASSGRLVVLESRLLPSELGRIADELRAQIIHIGRSGSGDDSPSSIRRKLRAQIIHIGRDMNPGVVAYFADQVIQAYDELEEQHPELPENLLAEKLRAQIIHIGSRLLVDVERRSGAVGEGVVAITASDAEGNDATLTHLVLVERIASLPTPPVDDGPLEMFLSEDGRQVLFSGERKGMVLYTELLDGDEPGWSVPKRLSVGDDFDAERVEQVLLNRVSRRR